MKHETVLVLDFGGQYNELIARRVRDLGVYCEVHPYKKALEKIEELSPIGIIFTGGPNSVYEEGAPKVDPAVFQQGLPILGLCYAADDEPGAGRRGEKRPDPGIRQNAGPLRYREPAL